MRFDRHSQQCPLDADQKFFVTAWLNMVHEGSLDSHRLRTMNARNALRESLRIGELPHADEGDRSMIYDEALQILDQDPVLARPRFIGQKNAIKRLLTKTKDKGRENEVLALYLKRELLDRIESDYLQEALTALREILIDKTSPSTGEARQSLMMAITNALLSTLADAGTSLESLYQLYAQVLIPRKPKQNYAFARRFELLKGILGEPEHEFKLLFAIDNVSTVEEFPPIMGEVIFFRDSAGWQRMTKIKPQFTTAPRRVFAEYQCSATDVRAAGIRAYAKINSILDLVRFEYERQKLQLSQEFLIQDMTKQGRVTLYVIPQLVPNPAASMEISELTDFVDSVNRLISSTSFSAEGRDRILSAFRLYRMGADANSFENKLTNWWTAVEFLVRGTKAGKGIGLAVERNLTPVLCLSYFEALLTDIRNTLLGLNIKLIDPANGAAIALREFATPDLYVLLTREDIRRSVFDSLAVEPFIQFKAARILEQLADASKALLMLEAHDRRIRWQIQRIWRARCDIVHSAKRAVQEALLCANLEFYLKNTLMALLNELRTINTLSSPEEFFVRRTDLYAQMKRCLKEGGTVGLQKMLSLMT